MPRAFLLFQALVLLVLAFACGFDKQGAGESPVDFGTDGSTSIDGAPEVTSDASMDSAPETSVDASIDVLVDAFIPSLALRAGLPGGSGTLDGTGIAARFALPYSVAVDGSGDVYVADQNNATIRKITSAGVVTTLAGTARTTGSSDGTGAAALFNGPSGVAVDGAGDVFVADTLNQTIRKITPAGVVTTLAGSAGVTGSSDGTGSAATFFYPSAVAVDAAGDVFVADSVNSTIRKITSAGVVTTFAGTAGQFGGTDGTGAAARFNIPEGVAVDTAGNVYVGDTNNETIRKITPAGVVTTLAGMVGVQGAADGTGAAASFHHPGGVIADSAGNVYVGDTYNQTVRKITPAGVVTTLAGDVGNPGSSDGTGAAAHFDNPKGVAVDAAGTVFLADYGTNTIRKITSAGVVTTIAGAAVSSGSNDGTGGAARFDFAPSSANGMAVDSVGAVFVSDTQNNTIRKVTAAGVVTTFAGSASVRGSADGAGSSASFFSPTGVAVDGAGNVYVGDTNNCTVRKISSAGVVTTFAGTARMRGIVDGTGAAARFYEPKGVAVDGAGNVFVADKNGFFGGGVVRRITAAGVVTTLAGDLDSSGSDDGTGAAAKFRTPVGIAVDGAGNVFVADVDAHTVRRITSAGVVTTLAGTANMSGTADGTGAAARFDRPKSVAVDGAGNVFVADSTYSLIRKITSAGVVTTVVGSPGTIGVRFGALPASLGALSSIAITPTGNLVVSAENAVLDVLLH